ncbi:hypothetical protein P7H42_00980 [Vagococcus lutrae]|uniref:hypothetical protein n=1 Tax=Vagococcus lutrae TaxID=81947 RepID=UPI000F877FCB|nr:hypothetical protein [Vagococcus lutrae]MCO7150230.1 hypothetical protein [Vagococcus lutrae]MDT2818335.1 hypothetical protein [Vagococcus lutrae]MDT2843098.1 hypothetical protein [Vagococcus lutrae]RST91275.1 hypothetical protein CBF33_07555 [Vagococcus lutrae]WCG05627.1 hypothetical protein PML89_02620 [Vagococcus lutrae]
MIKEKVESLIAMTDRQFGYYQVKLDPLKDKIPKDEVTYLIDESITCGKELAKELRQMYGEITTRELIERLDLNLTIKDTNTTLEYVYFGTFQPPNQITLYEKNIEPGANLLQSFALKEFEQIETADVVLAHELFHYFEENNPKLFINRYQIELWKVLGYTRRSGLIATSEIAAMAFAKEWLNLSFNVNLLDYVLLQPFNPELADNIWSAMMGGVENESE